MPSRLKGGVGVEWLSMYAGPVKGNPCATSTGGEDADITAGRGRSSVCKKWKGDIVIKHNA